MTLSERIRDRVVAGRPAPKLISTKTDVVFVVLCVLMGIVQLTIFFATLVIAPVTAEEQASLHLLHLPLEVARVLTLPFYLVLLSSLAILGYRIAGRWAGLTAVFALLSLDTRADWPLSVVYGPSVATGGYPSAALLATAFVLLPKHRVLPGALLGVAAVLHGVTAVTLPAFLIVLLIFPSPANANWAARIKELLKFVAAFVVPFVVGQLIWFADLGSAAYAVRLREFTAEFTPHELVDPITQELIIFRAWHFPLPLTLSLAFFLFSFAGIAVVRYFVKSNQTVPTPFAKRLPIELWAAALSFLAFSIWWAFSGERAVIATNLPLMVAVVPLATSLAYKGARWVQSFRGFWLLTGTVFLCGLIAARTSQMVLTLIASFTA